MHFQNIARFLKEFEIEHEAFLLKTEVYGWNAWSILKKPLYNQMRIEGIYKDTVQNNKTWKRALNSFYISYLYIYKLVISSIFKRSNPFFVSFNGNRVDVNSNEQYINPFIDPLILNSIEPNYLYFESFGRRKKKKGAINYDINNDGKNFPLILIEKFFIKDIQFKNVANDIHEKLAEFISKNGYENSIPKLLLFRILKRYYADYLWQNILLKVFKPKCIFIVDGIPSGLLGAAKRNGIRVYEFQHGIIGENKFEYIVSEKFKELSNKMPYPDYVCVFGEYFKTLLLKSKFWKEEQILVLGNYSIENRRVNRKINNINLQSNTNLKLLWATQPSVHKDSCNFLTTLMHLHFNAVVYIKPHPLEQKENLEKYYQLGIKNPNRIILLDSQNSLLDSLTGKHFLVSYHSTAILEAAALGFPTITISTKQFPCGINSYLMDDFSDIIKVIENPIQLKEFISLFYTDKNKYDFWKSETEKIGSYFFKDDYFNNIKAFTEPNN